MSQNKKKLSSKVGLPPGTLIHVGKKWSDQIKISVLDFDKENFSEIKNINVEDCFSYKNSNTESWINIDGLHNIETISKIGDFYELHPLLMEDVLNTHHRPKVEQFDNCLFITLKMNGISLNKKTIISEQVSFILGNKWLISFQEKEGDIFEDIRNRMRNKVGNIRLYGTDYLLYRLIDTIVDNYFYVTEYFNDVIEKLEEKVLISTSKETLREIQHLKKMLLNFRKSINPLREAIIILQKDNTLFIEERTTRYLRDVYEHIIQVNDSIDTLRDMLGGIMDLYLSSESNKMNQIMKVLTIIATIFIPLTFVAGIYGMNFENMPELKWEYGYLGVWILMIIVIFLMLFFFRKKRWL